MIVADTLDPIAWLQAQLDADLEVAGAADVEQHDPDWWVSPVMAAPGRYTVRSVRDNRPVARVDDVGDEGCPDPGSGPRSILDGRAVADHIALWDPARVLAEIKAKRAVLSLLAPPDLHRPDEGCQDCEIVRILAQPFADRPGFPDELKES